MTNWNQDQPAPKTAIRMIHANFPQVKNLGICVCRNVKGTNTKSAYAEGRAWDIGVHANRPGERLIGDLLFKALIARQPDLASTTSSGISRSGVSRTACPARLSATTPTEAQGIHTRTISILNGLGREARQIA
jgi:hypothetical protein